MSLVERRDTNGVDTRLVDGLMLFMALVSAGMAGFQVYTYYTTWMWQSLVVAAGSFAALVLIGAAYWVKRRGRATGHDERARAGFLLIAAVLSAYGSGELAFTGSTLLFIVGGGLSLLLVAALFFQRWARVWVAAMAVYAAALAAINLLEPIRRFDATPSSTLTVQVLLVILVCAFFCVWFLVRSMVGAGTIRSRLLVSFVGLVLLPLVVLGIATVVGGLRNGRQQVINHLESVAILKEAEIATWVDDLHADLALALLGNEATQQALLLLEGLEDPESVGLAEGVVRTRFEQTIAETRRFQELFLVNLDGRVVVSTDRLHEGNARGSQAYFRQGLQGEALQPPRYSPTDMSTSVFVARPVLIDQGDVQGVLVGRASLDRLNEIMLERAGLGQTGETYLVGATHTLLTPTRRGRLHVGVFSEGIDAAVDEQLNGSDMYRNNEGVAVFGSYRWLPELQLALIAEQEQAEAFHDLFVRLAVLSAVAVLAGALAVGASLLITRSISVPLAELAQGATRIARGDLRMVPEESHLFQHRGDEVGVLARVFYSMTDQLRSLVGGLESRVAERTHELERHSGYLEAAAEVGRAVSTILEANVLIQQVVEVIRAEFNLYYVGLFLVDDTGEWAVLRAATGEGGKAMLERDHRLQVGEESMVGWSVAHGELRVAQEASADSVRLATPELPETRSEVALPLRSRGKIIGALSVQGREPDAFDQDSLVVLQTMADQVAVALDNARLFSEREEALGMAQRAYGELSQEAWAEILRARTEIGFVSDRHGVAPASARLSAETEMALQLGQTMSGRGEDDGRHLLSVPIRVRGQVIGVIDTYKPAGAGDWSAEEITLMERIAEELDPALESARLYQDTQRRAARERAIRHVTDTMRRSVEIEAILEGTIVELARALGAPRVFVRLGTDDAVPTTSASVSGSAQAAARPCSGSPEGTRPEYPSGWVPAGSPEGYSGSGGGPQ